MIDGTTHRMKTTVWCTYFLCIQSRTYQQKLTPMATLFSPGISALKIIGILTSQLPATVSLLLFFFVCENAEYLRYATASILTITSKYGRPKITPVIIIRGCVDQTCSNAITKWDQVQSNIHKYILAINWNAPCYFDKIFFLSAKCKWI